MCHTGTTDKHSVEVTNCFSVPHNESEDEVRPTTSSHLPVKVLWCIRGIPWYLWYMPFTWMITLHLLNISWKLPWDHHIFGYVLPNYWMYFGVPPWKYHSTWISKTLSFKDKVNNTQKWPHPCLQCLYYRWLLTWSSPRTCTSFIRRFRQVKSLLDGMWTLMLMNSNYLDCLRVISQHR